MDRSSFYLDEVESLSATVEALIEAHRKSPAKSGPIGPFLDYASCNIQHCLDVEPERALSMAGLAAKSVAVVSEIDNLPGYLPLLLEHTVVHDDANVLEQAMQGRRFIFAGFHTGPYWSAAHELLRRGVPVVAAIKACGPEKLAAIREVTRISSGDRPHLFDIVQIEDPGFLRIIKARIEQGFQLVTYFDGVSGLAATTRARHAVDIPFLSVELTVKTTLLRLAGLLGIPLVTFNAMSSGLRRIVTLGEPLSVGPRSDCREDIMRIYARLAARLSVDFSSWETWSYLHIFLSDRYVRRVQHVARPHGRGKPSYFVVYKDGNPALAVDRRTFRAFEIGSGAGDTHLAA